MGAGASGSGASPRARVRAWFPTLVYTAPLAAPVECAALDRELLREAHRLREVDGEGLAWSRENYPHGYTSYGSMCQLHRFSSTFAELERRLRRHVRGFARRLDFDLAGRALEMTDCWVNIMGRDCQHDLHLHPTSTISGTYYVRTPPGSACIKFEDPRLGLFMAAPPRRAAPRAANRTFVRYEVAAGELILFESWLRHAVEPSAIDEERVSVSFNWSWF